MQEEKETSKTEQELAEHIRERLAEAGVPVGRWAHVFALIIEREITAPLSPDKMVLPKPAGEIIWPTEKYSEAHKNRGVNIIQFLEDPNGWFPLIQGGQADLRTLRRRDPSAAMGVNSYTKPHPRTGERRQLPAHLHLPTLSEVNDRAMAEGVVAIKDAGRLGLAFRRRSQTSDAKLPLPELPTGLSWPKGDYGESPEGRGKVKGGIVAYLNRVWLPILEAGRQDGCIYVDRRMVAKHYEGVIGAIKNYQQVIDKETGNRRRLPDNLLFPTIAQVTDIALLQGPEVIARDAKLAQVVATRRRRGMRIPGITE